MSEATTCDLPVGIFYCVRPAGHEGDCNRAYPNGSVGSDPGARVVTQDEWLAEAESLFGSHDDWKFRCPSCGTVSSVGDFKALGVDGQRAPFECIGRIHKEQGATYHIDGDTKPCNWAANGLIRLGNLTEVMYRDSAKTTFVFPFADLKAHDASSSFCEVCDEWTVHPDQHEHADVSPSRFGRQQVGGGDDYAAMQAEAYEWWRSQQ